MSSQKDSVMYTQLQPWSTVVADPCMEQLAGPPIPTRIGSYFSTPKRHPWRPTLAFEMMAPNHLPGQNVTYSIMDPCYTPKGMANAPLPVADLVTGFDRNPAHGARAALYTRYTRNEWYKETNKFFNQSETMQEYSKALKGRLEKSLKAANEQSVKGQSDVSKKLGERIQDLTFWRNEARKELENLLAANEALIRAKDELAKSRMELEGPLRITQECLYQREKRKGINLCHDNAERALLKEIATIKTAQQRLSVFDDDISTQFKTSRAVQQELENDVTSKEGALGVDSMCQQLNNYSKGINYYGGIENYDPSITNQKTWSENSSRIVLKSQAEREKTLAMAARIMTEINSTMATIWDAWNATNKALAKRVAEMTEAKTKLQQHLNKIQQEIFEIEKIIEDLKASIKSFSPSLKVAQTRIEARTHRMGVELCKDFAQDRLVEEVKDIQEAITSLHNELQTAEAEHQELLKTRADLETDLYGKVHAIFIDREKCMSMRSTFPLTGIIKY